jgi:hypothetical protein
VQEGLEYDRSKLKKVDFQEFNELCVASDVPINSRDIALGDIVSLYKRGK